MSTAGVLLAAGAGTRFVGPQHKLLAVIDGQTVLARALGSLVEAAFDSAALDSAALDEVAVITGAVDISAALAHFKHQFFQHQLGHKVAVVANERWDSGIGSSVRCAASWAAAAGHDAIVIGLADQPFVTPSAWLTVAAGKGPITVAVYARQRGNPVRLAKEVWPLLPFGGDEGARTLMRRLPEIVTPIACEGRPDDVDTMEDLRRWS